MIGKQPRKPISTAAQIEALKPTGGVQVEYPDARVPGLSIRVSSTGRKSWSLRYRNADSKQQRLSLGTFPAVGLADARQAALDALGTTAKGDDPAAAKRVRRAAGKESRPTTVSGLLDAYFADAERGRHRPNGRPKRATTLALDRYYVDRHIRPRMGSRPIADIRRHEVQTFLDDVGAGAPSTGRHCRAVLRQAFNYAIRRELAVSNPAALADMAAGPQRERVLTSAEMASIWNGATGEACEAFGLTVGMGLAIRFAMLTLQRGGEVCGLHADEIDRDRRIWTIPGIRTKNHRVHVVPLSDAAMTVLAEAFDLHSGPGSPWQGFAFPGRPNTGAGSTGSRPITRGSFSRASKRLTRSLGIPDVTPHDFRRTGATNITGEQIGLPRFHVSRVLNQSSDTGGAAAVTAVYDRNSYLAEKRKALDAWAALLAEIVSGERRAANVVPLAARG